MKKKYDIMIGRQFWRAINRNELMGERCDASQRYKKPRQKPFLIGPGHPRVTGVRGRNEKPANAGKARRGVSNA
jgi:hypothetical protein